LFIGSYEQKDDAQGKQTGKRIVEDAPMRLVGKSARNHDAEQAPYGETAKRESAGQRSKETGLGEEAGETKPGVVKAAMVPTAKVQAFGLSH
jgi:hypothetical protein